MDDSINKSTPSVSATIGAQMPYPILYSLQHCPYAIRARLGLFLAQQTVSLRAVVLKNKPRELLAASAKGTVPVLVINEQSEEGAVVIDESLDIMLWALKKHDPQNVLHQNTTDALPEMLGLIRRNDLEFIVALDKYKCAKRYHDDAQLFHRQQCEQFVGHLEQRLNVHGFLMGSNPSLADYAILPFIRRFAKVDRKWYVQSPYPNVQRWLKGLLEQPLFTKVMAKYPLWDEQQKVCLFAEG